MRIILIFLYITCAFQIKAQSLTGKVFNEKKQPIEFASIYIKNTTDSTVTKGAITDTTGIFKILDVKPGNYKIAVSSLGYETLNFLVTISRDSAENNLSYIILKYSSKDLNEVIVKGEKPNIERLLGKIIVNTSNSFFKTASNTLDLIKLIPGIQVNALGNITIRGSITPVVYIDGKQQPLTTDELLNLSPDNIESIEVISNSTAQLDGNVRAIINIKMKIDTSIGWKGSSYFSYNINKLYSGYSNGLGISYKSKRIIWVSQVGYSLNNNFLTIQYQRYVESKQDLTSFNGNTLVHRPNKPLTYQFLIDYILSENSKLSLMLKGVYSHSREISSDNTAISDTTFRERYLITDNKLNTNQIDASIDVNYVKKIGKGGDQISANLDYAHFATSKTQNLNSYYIDNLKDIFYLSGNFPTNIAISSIKTDYTHSITPKSKLDLGIKYSNTSTINQLLYDTLNNLGQRSIDLTRSNRFEYRESNSAIYGQYNKETNSISYNLGIRVEHTESSGKSITLNEIVARNYFRWLPSFQLLYQINDSKNLSISYSRKLARPSFYELNPFQFYVNKYLYSEGNPYLIPTQRNVLETSYSNKYMNITFSYIFDKNAIGQIPIQDVDTKVMHYTRLNLDLERTISVDISAPFVISKLWKMQHSTSIFYNQLKSNLLDGVLNNKLVSFYCQGQQTFNMSNIGLICNLNYDYISPTVSQIYRTKGFGTVSLSIQKVLKSGKGNIQLNINDLFNTYREAFAGVYQDVNTSVIQKRNVQQASLKFTFNFGKSTYTPKSKTSGINDEEKRVH